MITFTRTRGYPGLIRHAHIALNSQYPQPRTRAEGRPQLAPDRLPVQPPLHAPPQRQRVHEQQPRPDSSPAPAERCTGQTPGTGSLSSARIRPV